MDHFYLACCDALSRRASYNTSVTYIYIQCPTPLVHVVLLFCTQYTYIKVLKGRYVYLDESKLNADLDIGLQKDKKILQRNTQTLVCISYNLVWAVFFVFHPF